MDPLSRALAETHLRGSLIATVDLFAPWHIDFEQSVGVPIHYVISGDAWLHLPNAAPVQLAPGDLVAFPRWDRHFLASSATPGDRQSIRDIVRDSGQSLWFQGEWHDEPLSLTIPGEGPRTQLLSLVVEPERGAADLLLLALPRVIHIPREDATLTPWVAPMLSFQAAEQAQPKPGYAIVQSRLAELLFMQIVRLQLLLCPPSETASLRILLDPAIAKVDAALRERLGHRWKLAEMARIGGLSRTVFAARFARCADMTPFEYLRALRLDAAADRLKHGEAVKAQIEASGYATAYSFAKAFRARFATTPGAYRALFRAQATEQGPGDMRHDV